MLVEDKPCPNVDIDVPSIYFSFSEVISSFRSLRAGAQLFTLFMLFLCANLHTMSSSKTLQ